MHCRLFWINSIPIGSSGLDLLSGSAWLSVISYGSAHRNQLRLGSVLLA
jgi:hypothetical protein